MLPSSGSEKILRVKLRWETDKASADKASQGAKEQAKGAQAAGDQYKKATSALDQMNRRAGQMAAVGGAMTVAFGGAFKAMIAGAQSYVAQVGTSEAASRRWLGSQKAIEESGLRIGRVIAEQAAPAMEKIADVAEKTADFVEKHPEAVKAALNITASLAMIGGLLVAAATIMKVATVAGKIGLGGAAGAAGGAAAGAAGGAAGGAAMAGGGILGMLGAGAAGAGLGALIYDQLAKHFGLGGGTRLNQFATVGAYGAGKMFGGEETGLAWAKTIGELTGAIQKADTASQSASREIDFTSQEINAYIGYIRQEQAAERQRRIQLERLNRDFQRQEQIETADYLKQRQRSMRDFLRQEQFEERNYYRERAIRSRDYNKEVQRAEEDHQKELRRSQEDHKFQMWDIIRSGDALAFMRSERQYEIGRERSEEDYQIEARRRSEDYANQIKDAEEQFRIQRQQRRVEFEQRQKDEAEDFKIRRQRAKEQFKIQLSDMQKDFDEQRLLRRQSLIDQLRDLRGSLEQERILRREFTTAMLNDLRAAIDQGESGTNLVQGSRASGGYVGAGLYRMHSGEFVLKRETTQEFERAAQGKLTQENALSLIGGGKPVQLNYNDNRQFSGEVSDAFRMQIMRDTEQALIGVVEALRTKTLMAGG